MDNNFQSKLSHKLVRHGMILFSLGLLTGFLIPVMRNPRMGLASHLEAIMNAMFLILLAYKTTACGSESHEKVQP